jgi:nucleoside-diphosphate-sugar epimerase
MKFTVFGATGFIGGHMARHLRAQGIETETPARGADLKGRDLGHVIYAIGVVGGAKNKTAEMIEAHATLPERLLREAKFDSFLYLSSTRVYDGLKEGREDAPLSVLPGAGSVFALSKMMGEAVCLAHSSPAVRVARLSNIYGPGQSEMTFLGAVLRDLKAKKEVTILEAPDSSKDYLAVAEAVRLLQAIAVGGKERIYNVASGAVVTHRRLADTLGRIGFAPGGATRTFPAMDVSRITREFGAPAAALLDDLPRLMEAAHG